ncbi:MAG TPA: hypothetical protein VJ376_10085 [Pseudomonadota bacterium]|nr:hypothetical protein [Pseudomonadota bacterium]
MSGHNLLAALEMALRGVGRKARAGVAPVRISAAFDVDVSPWVGGTVGGRAVDIPLQGGFWGAVVILVVIADAARMRRASEPEFAVFMDVAVRMRRGGWRKEDGVPELRTSRR